MHYALPQLIALDERFPTERKLLLVPSINFGRELLAALAHERGSWIGWEVATLATIAQKLAIIELAKRGRRRASDVAIAEAVSSAFDAAIAAGGVTDNLATLSGSAGTRSAIVDAVLELRIAGADAACLKSVGSVGVAPSLAAVTQAYDAVRAANHLADAADVFQAAITAFDDQAPFVLDHALLVCTPGWSVRGIPRQLLEKLVGRGLQSLQPLSHPALIAPTDLIERALNIGHASRDVTSGSPDAAMFYAGTIADELRQIFREILKSGRRLDEVEIACTDRDAYGIELDALCEHIDASYTSLDGLALQRTRIGRAVERWFNWLDSDYTAEHIRGAIESGDWKLDDVSDSQVAAELRRLQIGWGLEATRRGRERLTSEHVRDRIRQYDDETADHFATRKANRFKAMDALADLLDNLIANAPVMREGGADGQPISVPMLAEQTARVLASLIRARGAAEHSTMQRVLERLAAIAAVPRELVSPANALATLRQELSDLRAWTNCSKTPRPRRATGGHIHLTNIESAGATGRPLQFLVGLDADRSAGPLMQSPLLPDSLRARLNERGADLATTETRRHEGAWKLANAIHGSTAKLTLSYAMRGGADGRDGSPSAALLQAAREILRQPDLNYENLREHLGAPVSAIPSALDAAVDDRDVWLGSMNDGALLLNAERAVRAHYHGLDRGLHAQTARDGGEAGEYHGLVPAAGRLDPRKTGQPISPSSLEMIAACSLRWFYSAALNARAPEEPAFDALVWLNALDRGSALHSIYEKLVRERLYETPDSDARRERIVRIVSEVAAKVERDIPVPSAAVKARELQALHNDALLFVSSEHDAFVKEPWEVAALESKFGSIEPAVVPLDDGTELLVHGRVDRVDRMRDGTLRLVDYKSGRSWALDTKRGAFDGGRKLQLAVYSPAIAAQLAAVVSVAEYRFPTERGEGEVARAGADMLDVAPRIVRSLLDDVAAGRFVPTIDESDCAHCDFKIICRTTPDRFSHKSPRAAWAAAHADDSPHFVGVLVRKRSGDAS